MSGFIALVPLLLVPLLYAVLVKLAARLLRRMQLSWKHALLFGLIALVVGTIGTVANQSTGRVLPALVAGLLGVAIQLVVGGWYLGPRTRTASGELIGFGRGALLSLVAFGIVFAIGIATAFLLPVGKQP